MPIAGTDPLVTQCFDFVACPEIVTVITASVTTRRRAGTCLQEIPHRHPPPSFAFRPGSHPPEPRAVHGSYHLQYTGHVPGVASSIRCRSGSLK